METIVCTIKKAQIDKILFWALVIMCVGFEILIFISQLLGVQQ